MFKEASEFIGEGNVIGIESILQAGSDRHYERILTNGKSYILCHNENVHENNTFIYFTQIFHEVKLPVPTIYAVSEDRKDYLLSDNGRSSLLDEVMKNGYTDEVKKLYELSLSHLARMQVEADMRMDYSYCFAAKQFDKQAVLADLNYFKYYFLDLHKIIYDKASLNLEFEQLANEVAANVNQHFMFRDFQGRNILIDNQQPFFIDYQGGMKGPLQYDVASLLWQAKANLPMAWRTELYAYYKDELKQYIAVHDSQFDMDYSLLLLVRLVQVLGAYGLRGLIEKRSHFLSSIPQGLQNIVAWMSEYNLPTYPVLTHVLQQLTTEEFIKKYTNVKATSDTKLTIRVNSFSYKKGIPQDASGNGGGFVFDCRGVLNPGRFEEYKKLTGRDKPVIDFLESKTRIHEFLAAAKQAVEISVDDYLARGFEHLMISFGCTGGQHRSVYSADAMAKHLKEKYNLDAVVTHVEQEAKGWVN
jgi:aminoglycoside/choline kinase family phosphotransferase